MSTDPLLEDNSHDQSLLRNNEINKISKKVEFGKYHIKYFFLFLVCYLEISFIAYALPFWFAKPGYECMESDGWRSCTWQEVCAVSTL